METAALAGTVASGLAPDIREKDNVSLGQIASDQYSNTTEGDDKDEEDGEDSEDDEA